MPVFRYRALADSGQKITGRVTADNEVALERQIADLGYDLISARRERTSQLRSLIPKRVRLRDLVEFCIDMEELIRAGVPVVEAVQDVRDASGSEKLRDVLSDVARDLGNGALLSEAFGNHPETFDHLFVGVVNAGERSGDLESAFGHLARHLRWTDDMNKRLRAAARYPAFTLVVTLGLAGAMMIFLVPQLTSFLTSIQVELPVMTIALMATSAFVREYWWLILLAPAAGVLLLVFARRRSARAARVTDAALLRIPFVGETMRKIAMSRFAQFFTIMYTSGVGILECLDTARGVVGNRALADALTDARNQVERGSTLTDSFQATGAFPAMVVRMIRVGEETGSLDKALESVRSFYDRDVADTVQNLVDSVQPALTIVIGALLGWIVLAVLGPMYSSFSQLPI